MLGGADFEGKSRMQVTRLHGGLIDRSSSRFVSARDFRQGLWPSLAGIVILLPVLFGLINAQNSEFRSNLELFSVLANTPVLLLVPALAAPMGNLVLFQDLGHRHVVNIRLRQSTASYISGRLFVAAMLPALAYALSMLALLVIAFMVWPAIGNPEIDPSLATRTSFGADSELFTYSQLATHGSTGFAGFYLGLIAVSAGGYGILGALLLLTLNNRLLALVLPTIVYFVETFAAAFLGTPQWGLLYASDPFGLQQTSILLGAAPLLILWVTIALFATWTLLNRFNLSRLT